MTTTTSFCASQFVWLVGYSLVCVFVCLYVCMLQFVVVVVILLIIIAAAVVVVVVVCMRLWMFWNFLISKTHFFFEKYSFPMGKVYFSKKS